MNQIVNSQALLFITSVEIGILMGILYDLIRISRKIVKHPNFLVQIEDMLYWIVCGLIGFYMLYITNYAAIRPFIFIGMILGAIFYFTTFSIVFMKIATIVINYIKELLKKVFRLLLIPTRGVIHFILIPLKYISQKYHKFQYYKQLKLRELNVYSIRKKQIGERNLSLIHI